MVPTNSPHPVIVRVSGTRVGMYLTVVCVIKRLVRIAGSLVHGKVASFSLPGGDAESWVLYGGHVTYGAPAPAWGTALAGGRWQPL
jgi:hypothetical protein